MKILAFTLILIGLLFGAFLTLALSEGDAELAHFLLLAIPLLLIGAGVLLWRIKTNPKHAARARNVVRAIFTLTVGIPMLTFALVLIPTVIGSLFLPPGKSEWIAYGSSAIILPMLLWMWVLHQRMVFSVAGRGVVFMNPGDQSRYDKIAALALIGEAKTLKTSTNREGTFKAKIEMYRGNALYGSLFLVLIGLTRIPIVGLIFSPLKNMVFEKGGRRIDELREAVDRLEAPTLDEIVSADARQPVLLLRSFLDDALVIDSLESEGKNTDTITFEELICREASNWGPVVAIGDPKENSPPLGAARAYCTNDTWQDYAIRLLERSFAVVLIMGHTPSVTWELEKILRAGYFTKTIVMIPPTTDAGYCERLVLIRDILARFEKNLPLELPPGHYLLSIAFDEEGTPKPISGPHRVSLACTDALLLASKVVNCNSGSR